MPTLFDPIAIGGKTLKNRIAMPPMVWFGMPNEPSALTPEHIAHYEARAAAGTGLIIIEANAVAKDGRFPGQRAISGDEHIPALAEAAEKCHKNGAAVLVQIHHCGLSSTESEPIGPSDVDDGNFHGRGMTVDEILRMRDAFIAAGVRAWKAGLDGVELHGCHQYLLNNFASPVYNRRTDAWGGDVRGRTRLAREITEGIRAACGGDFLITVRMGGNDPDIAGSLEIADAYLEAGIQALDVSSGMGPLDAVQVPEGYPFSPITWLATSIKRHVAGKAPVMAVYGIRTPEQARELIAGGYADIACIGKAMLADPDWTRHALEMSAGVSCLGCKPCMWYSDAYRCPRAVARKKRDASCAL